MLILDKRCGETRLGLYEDRLSIQFGCIGLEILERNSNEAIWSLVRTSGLICDPGGSCRH